MLFRKPALVLGLQVGAIHHRELELFPALDQELDGFRVGDALKGPLQDEIKPCQQLLVHELSE